MAGSPLTQTREFYTLFGQAASNLMARPAQEFYNDRAYAPCAGAVERDLPHL